MSCASLSIEPEPIKVKRGATTTLRLTARNSNKQTVDLTGAKVWFTVKNRFEDAAACITKKNAAAGGVDGQILITMPQTGATKGQAKIFLVPADTAGMSTEETYWCDAWVQLATGERYQVIQPGQFLVESVVTTQF